MKKYIAVAVLMLAVILSGCGAPSKPSTKTPTAVVITPSSASVEVNHTQQFTANTAVTWGASHGAISSTGLYTAPAEAIADTVTAISTANSSETASARVTVNPPPVVSISIISGNDVLAPGQTVQFGATERGAPNTSVVWTSSAGSITTDGIYTAPSVPDGTTEMVTATSAYDSTVFASTSVTVTTLPVIKAAISPSTVSNGSYVTFTITWSAYNTSGVTILPSYGEGISGLPSVGSQEWTGIVGNGLPTEYTVTAEGTINWACPACVTPQASVNVYATVTP